MVKKGLLYQFMIFFFIILLGCIEAYPPPIIDEEINFLVVDGFLNSTDSTAQVKLSRAVALSSQEASPIESNAHVNIEDVDGNIHPLTEKGNGLYQLVDFPIDIRKEYRVNIKTSDLNEYQSDFIVIKETPEIDSVGWAISKNNDGVDILVNTHDNTNQTRYYKWFFEETYQYEAPYLSVNKFKDGQLVDISENDRTFVCWRTLRSNKILVASTERLSQDVIYKFPIANIPKGDQRLLIKYSVLVKQIAISREAFDYWTNLQKTTENLGSLFDPQPGQVTGNIRSINNPSVPVLGFFSGGNIQEKRLFIKKDELPIEYDIRKPLGMCRLDTAELATVIDNSRAIVYIVYSTTGIKFVVTTNDCVDCRKQGGVTTKPLFWD